MLWAIGRRAVTASLVKGANIEEINGPAAAIEGLDLQLLFRQVLAYVPGSILPALVGLVSAAIFTRTFSAGAYGQYSLVLSVSALATALSSQWLQQAINRYLPGATDIATHQAIKRAVALGMLLIVAVLSGVSLLLILFHNALLPEWQGFILPGALLVMTISVYNPLGAMLQAEMMANLFSRYALANAVAKLLFSIIIVFAIIHTPSGMVWGAVLSTTLLLPMLWRRGGLPSLGLLLHSDIWLNSWRDLMRFAAYGFPMIGWFLSATLLNVGDRYVIQLFRGSAEVGIYSANYNLIQAAIGLIAAPVLLAAHPFLMRAWGEGDKANAGRWLGTIAEWFAMAGIIMVGATWLFSEDLATWFLGPEFRSGHVIMPAVIAGVVAWQLGMYAHKPLEFSERTGLMFALSLAAAGLNLTLNIIFVPFYGYAAAAYTTLLSYLIYAIVTSIIGQRVLRWQITVKPIVTITILTVIADIGLSYLRLTVQQSWGYGLGFMVAIMGYAIIVITAALKLTSINIGHFFKSVRR